MTTCKICLLNYAADSVEDRKKPSQATRGDGERWSAEVGKRFLQSIWLGSSV